VTSTVAGLRTLLMARGGAWQTALAQGRALRVAVNQEMAQPATPVKPGDEVAFFPPVTGGLIVPVRIQTRDSTRAPRSRALRRGT